MPTGFKQMGSMRETRKSAGSKFPELRLRAVMAGKEAVAEDAKIARIRFLTDWGEDLTWGCFHNIPTTSRLGKKYKKEVYCLRSGNEEAECIYCQDEDGDISWSNLKFFFFVYVYEIYHVHNNKDKSWKKAEYAGETYFLEPVNSVMVLKTGPGRSGATEDRFNAWFKRNKTLKDRDYDWCRNGFSFDETNYDLVPCDEITKLTADQKKIVEELPSLEETVIFKPVAKPKKDKAGKGKDEDDEDAKGKGKDKPVKKPAGKKSSDDVDKVFDEDDDDE